MIKVRESVHGPTSCMMDREILPISDWCTETLTQISMILISYQREQIIKVITLIHSERCECVYMRVYVFLCVYA